MTEQEVNQKAKEIFLSRGDPMNTEARWNGLDPGSKSYWRYLARRAAWKGPEINSVAEHEEDWEDWVSIANQILGDIPTGNIPQKRFYVEGGRRLAIMTDREPGLWYGYSPRNDSEYAEGSLEDWQNLARGILGRVQ
jgi:hypothetical protein